MVPAISVIMPVYNAGAYLKDAVESILSQTFRGFEFIIVNDGSDDGSAEVIRTIDDPRIVRIDNRKNVRRAH
jgi:glycosyltransferase involved in cell wall biosynthesis